MASDHHGRSNLVKGELALNAQGRFLALRVDWVADMGAWLTPPQLCAADREMINHSMELLGFRSRP